MRLPCREVGIALEMHTAPVDRNGRDVSAAQLERNTARRDEMRVRRDTMHMLRDDAETALSHAITMARSLLRSLGRGAANGGNQGARTDLGLLAGPCLLLDPAIHGAEYRALRAAESSLNGALALASHAVLFGGGDGLVPSGRWATDRVRDARIVLADILKALSDPGTHAELVQHALLPSVGRTPCLGMDRNKSRYWALPWPSSMFLPVKEPRTTPSQPDGCGGEDESCTVWPDFSCGIWVEPGIPARGCTPWRWYQSAHECAALQASLDTRGHGERGLHAAIHAYVHGAMGAGPLPTLAQMKAASDVTEDDSLQKMDATPH